MPDRALITFGTGDAEMPPQRLVAGAVTADLFDGALRGVSWHGREIVRGVNCLVRDVNWGTDLPENIEDRLDADARGFRFERRFTVAAGGVSGRLSFSGRDDGRLRAEMSLTAKSEIMTNRAGFTVLHPLEGFVGKRVRVTHEDGGASDSTIPELIMPSQPVFDIAGMDYEVDGIAVSFRFEGETFEMEDQRNWTDASFKTYCRPLSKPWPYPIKTGETLTQAITLTLSGEPGALEASAEPSEAEARRGVGRAPEIALAVEAGWILDAKQLAPLATLPVRLVQLRVRRGGTAVLRDAQPLIAALGAAVDLEVVVADSRGQAAAELQAVAAACREAGLRPQRVIALPEAFLKSYQPTAVWPAGLQPEDAAELAGAAFPDALIGGGMLTDFTELNRRRPERTRADFITHSTTAIVHAADDRSVLETLETLPHVFRSAAALAAGRDYRLGLVAIAMRQNPNGAAVADNPGLIRKPMAGIDPRQDGLFAAAWAVGALAATGGSAITALALAAPAGPFGLVGAGGLRPLFHVVRAAAAMGGQERIAYPGLPAGVVAYGVHEGGASRAIFANLGPAPVQVAVEQPVAVLDVQSAPAAAADPRWSESAGRKHSGQIELQPFAVAVPLG